MKLIILFTAAIGLIWLTVEYLHEVELDFAAQLSVAHEQREMKHEFAEFALQTTDENGELEFQIHSPSTVFYADEFKTDLDFPHMVLYRAGGQPINITAEFATIDHASDLTTLLRNVDVEIPNRGDQPLLLETEKLLFDNVQQVATTDEHATILHGKSSMQGVGLEYGFNSKEIKFLNQVRGVYEK